MNRNPPAEPLREPPLLSVIVPSFNQGKFIRQTIESCLAQDYRPIEILVVDGASNDGTPEILRAWNSSPEVRWTSEPDTGPVEAVNKGLARAAGEIGLIQSADDLSVPGAFRAAVDAFRARPEVALVYGDVERIDETGRVLDRLDVGRYSLRALLARRTYVPQPCAFFRMDPVRSSGGWDERFPYCPDTDLWFRLALAAPVIRLPGVLGRTRVHGGQRDGRRREVFESYARMMRESETLARAPAACRRAARAGFEFLKLRYNPGLTDAQICRALWKAVVLHPPLLFCRALPKHRLVPGYFRLAGLAGAALRGLGIRRRKSGSEADG
jgi:glycosyltransferase involved in cell wall biosynthesis